MNTLQSIPVIDLILCAVTYVILTYVMVLLIRKRRNTRGNNDDDGGGGIDFDKLPELDLPPGISLPINSDSPKKPVREPELV